MKFPKLEALALSAYLALPDYPQQQSLQLDSFFYDQEHLVEMYQDNYHQFDGFLPKKVRKASFLGQDIEARWYISEEARKPVYSIITSSSANNTLLFFVAEAYLDEIKKRYMVNPAEAEYVRRYIKSNIAGIDQVRIDLQYAANQSHGILKLYDSKSEALLDQTFISSSLVLATLHFCSVEALGKKTDFLENYDVVQREGKFYFELRDQAITERMK